MILCLESSADPTVIGLADENSENTVIERIFQSRDQFPLEVETLLRENNVVPKDVTAIAIGIGPGSFTGLRVSLAFAKGFARGVNIPIWPVPSLRIVAANLYTHWPLIAVISPARRNHVHFAVFDGDSIAQRGESKVLSHEQMLTELTDDMALIGPGVAKLQGDVLKSAGRYLPLDESMHRPQIAHLARLALTEWWNKQAPDISTLVPVYGMEFGSE
jgi:tRNA threonylcarbamoyladenosine biosynthesis protein TsaB